jgi:hypothetical protein
MDKLKPCPFCGGNVELKHKEIDKCGNRQDGHLVTRWGVRCVNCGIEKDGGVSLYWFRHDETLELVSSNYDGRKKAIEAWNRRAADNKEIDFDYEAEDGQ